MNIVKFIRKYFSWITRGEGESQCDHCYKNVSTFMGGTGTRENNYKHTVQCMECCEKENEGIEFKYENKDEHAQTVEYNGYRDGEKIGPGVRIHYFTDEQVKEIEKIRDEIQKDAK